MGLGKHVVGTFCIVRPEIVSKPFSLCHVARELAHARGFFLCTEYIEGRIVNE